jgi:hypothetical protein
MKIPYGEVQCDVWTIARNDLFLDAPPFYLKLPKQIYNHWVQYSKQVRELCVKAIVVRKIKRQYLKWLENEILSLYKSL